MIVYFFKFKIAQTSIFINVIRKNLKFSFNGMSWSEQFPSRFLPENIALHDGVMRTRFQQVSGVGLSMPKLKQHFTRESHSQNKNKNKNYFFTKTHVIHKQDKSSEKDKNLRNGELSSGLRETRNVGRAVAEERVVGKVISNIELRYKVWCVPRHVGNLDLWQVKRYRWKGCGWIGTVLEPLTPPRCGTYVYLNWRNSLRIALRKN